MSIWLMLFIFLCIANLPWIGDRVFLLFPMQAKPLWLRFIELLVYYFIVLLIGVAFETQFSGDVYQQQWEFFVTVLCLFLVLSAPGLIYRYQWLPTQATRR